MILPDDIDEAIQKYARGLAQAETAHRLRAGTLTADYAQQYEDGLRATHVALMRSAFEKKGKLPAGIAMDVRQVAALPRINDLAGREEQDISITNLGPVRDISPTLLDQLGSAFSRELNKLLIEDARRASDPSRC